MPPPWLAHSVSLKINKPKNILKKYIMKYLRVKGYDICNLPSIGGKKVFGGGVVCVRESERDEGMNLGKG